MIVESERLEDLRLSPWYLNTRRIAAATAHEINIDAYAAIVRRSSQRAAAMSLAGRIARDMLLSGKIPNLLSLPERAKARRVLLAVWSTFTLRGMPAAFRADVEAKCPLQARLRGDIALGSKNFRISGALYADHVYSISAGGYLCSKKRPQGVLSCNAATRSCRPSSGRWKPLPSILLGHASTASSTGQTTTEFCRELRNAN